MPLKKIIEKNNVAIGYLNSIISAFSFWGAYFLLTLVINHDIPYIIFFILFLASKELQLFFGCLLALSTAFVIVFVLNLVNLILIKRVSVLEIIGTYVLDILSTPYRGIDIRPLINKNANLKLRKYESELVVFRLLKMVIWWLLLLFSIKIIKAHYTNELTDKIYIIVSTALLMNIAAIVVNRIIMAKRKVQK